MIRASGRVTFLVTVEYDDVMISDAADGISDGIEEPDWVDGRSITATFPGAFRIHDIEMTGIEDENYVGLEEEERKRENLRLAKEHEDSRTDVESRYV